MSKIQSNPPAQSLTDYLHLFVLVGFAVAQPLYDILGQNPEFFVAHQAGPVLIITLVLFLSIGLALIIIFVELIARIFGERLRRIVHSVLAFLLVALIVSPPVKRWIGDNDLIMTAFVLTVAILFTVFYVRLSFIRLFMTALFPAILIFPLWFVWATPVARLVMPQTIEMHVDIKIENKVPVVLVVLDEFNTTALLDAKGQIDSVRFPNFAALAAESYWFPNAVATHFTTNQAVPALLTGRQPRPEMKLASTASNYPQNIFTMLNEQYRLNVFEPLTEMCPEEVCQRESNTDTPRRYTAFFC